MKTYVVVGPSSSDVSADRLLPVGTRLEEVSRDEQHDHTCAGTFITTVGLLRVLNGPRSDEEVVVRLSSGLKGSRFVWASEWLDLEGTEQLAGA